MNHLRQYACSSSRTKSSLSPVLRLRFSPEGMSTEKTLECNHGSQLVNLPELVSRGSKNRRVHSLPGTLSTGDAPCQDSKHVQVLERSSDWSLWSIIVRIGNDLFVTVMMVDTGLTTHGRHFLHLDGLLASQRLRRSVVECFERSFRRENALTISHAMRRLIEGRVTEYPMN